jgi:hypothetical protein
MAPFVPQHIAELLTGERAPCHLPEHGRRTGEESRADVPDAPQPAGKTRSPACAPITMVRTAAAAANSDPSP